MTANWIPVAVLIHDRKRVGAAREGKQGDGAGVRADPEVYLQSNTHNERGMTMTERPKPIRELYAFLVEHHHVNAAIQQGFLGESLSPATVDDRALLLMHRVLQTQSRPKLDRICQFFSRIRDQGAYQNFAAFHHLITVGGKLGLVDGLALQPGWGAKTAALFVRNLAYIESTPKLRAKFWRDTRVLEGDQLRLPVDAVILTIFKSLAR